MTIFLLGTSNCIVHGSFVETIRAGTSEPVVNVSVGSCSSGVGLYAMHEIAPREGDVALLDYAITDTLLMLQKVRTAREIRAYLEAIVAPLMKAGCVPIVLINALRDRIEGPMPGRDVHLRFCRDWGLPYVDNVRLLRRALRRGAPLRAMMADSAHFTLDAHAIVGVGILAAIARVRDDPPPLAGDRRGPWRTRRVIAREIAAPAYERRGTRLRSAELALLRVGDRAVLDIAADERMIGLMVNMGAAGAKARFSGGATSIVANLEYEWDNRNPDSFMALFVEFRDYLRGGSDGIAIEVLPSDAVATEPFHPRRAIPGCYGEVQIEGVLVGTARATVAPGLGLAPAIDLYAGAEEALAARLCAIGGRRELAA